MAYRLRNESRARISIPILQKKGLRLILALEVAESRDSVSDSPGVQYLGLGRLVGPESSGSFGVSGEYGRDAPGCAYKYQQCGPSQAREVAEGLGVR